ncbi:MAG: hypothetical protein QY320_01600 [Gammaproteobacteria bacterium]|nr:MAG: hypothetical protein QY320_01600 [Gammaproteobacteria bacterium]
MLSFVFLAFALVHLGIWLWGWRLWAQTGRPVALFLVLFGGTLLFYDNLRIGLGRFIGPGELLHALSVPAFAWHWTMLPLLVIAAGSVARLAGLPWARGRLVMACFCVAAVLLSALDLPKIFTMDLQPACLADTVRYSTHVSAAQVCPGGQPVQGHGGPLVAILTNLMVLAVGIALWAQRRWPWLAVGAATMFVAAGAFTRSPWSLPIANFGEICITLAFIMTCVHFARLRLPSPDRSPAMAMRRAA